jgi:hypothetical protein
VILFASSPTPKVGNAWVSCDSESRLNQINKVLEGTDFVEFITPTRALDDGQVYFSFKKQISSSIRGVFLLDLEILIKNRIDTGIIIWCEPIGDKNSLRNLRGIEIIT